MKNQEQDKEQKQEQELGGARRARSSRRPKPQQEPNELPDEFEVAAIRVLQALEVAVTRKWIDSVKSQLERARTKTSHR